MSAVPAVPPEDTVERWAWDYVHAETLAHKLEPPALPRTWEETPPVRRLERPGRPPELRVQERADKTRGLGSPAGRARAVHTFFHHELQAAELMAWAVLAFPDAPRAFREGLLRIALDEARHMRLYRDHLARLGYELGAFPVRDWFWTRVPTCKDAASFVAVMGLGLESANLEHTASFARRFREAGDEEGARLQEIVGREEIAHVRFGVRWFAELCGELTFEAWQAALPPPLTPLLMRGHDLQHAARRLAGQPDTFVEELDRWRAPGS
jgi:uncharacterized ferritin-like protein (DUF455 family)